MDIICYYIPYDIDVCIFQLYFPRYLNDSQLEITIRNEWKLITMQTRYVNYRKIEILGHVEIYLHICVYMYIIVLLILLMTVYPACLTVFAQNIIFCSTILDDNNNAYSNDNITDHYTRCFPHDNDNDNDNYNSDTTTTTNNNRQRPWSVDEKMARYV